MLAVFGVNIMYIHFLSQFLFCSKSLPGKGGCLASPHSAGSQYSRPPSWRIELNISQSRIDKLEVLLCRGSGYS